MPVAYGLIEPIDLPVPTLPDRLEGLRIAHLTDLHISRHRRRHNQLINQITGHRLDLVVLTGDYMSSPGDEPTAVKVIQRLAHRLKARLGVFGVFGNHDSPALREQLADLPIDWLHEESRIIADGQIEIMGVLTGKTRQPDFAKLALSRQTPAEGATPAFRLLLSHYPTPMIFASDMGVDLMLAGHTHGGQCRLPGGHALINSSDLPLDRSCGVMRYRETLTAVSRGLGEIKLPIRAFCPPHVPVYTLRKRSLAQPEATRIARLIRW